MDPNRVSLSTAITLTAHNRNNCELKTAMGYLYWQLLYRQQIMREEFVASYGIVPLPYTQQSEDSKIPAVRRKTVLFLTIIFTLKLSRYVFCTLDRPAALASWLCFALHIQLSGGALYVGVDTHV